MNYEYLALGTAFLWAVTSLIHADLSRSLGGTAYNRLRLTIMAVVMPLVALALGGWNTVDTSDLFVVMLSGFIGFSLGDSAMLMSMQYLGPRRTQIIYSFNAPMTVFLGVIILSEYPTYLQLLGVTITFLGIFIAIAYGKRKEQTHSWEDTEGKLWIGIMWGVFGALSQAVGIILLKPVLNNGADPFVLATIRIMAAGGVIACVGYFLPQTHWYKNITWKQFMWTLTAGVFGIIIAVGFFLTYALKLGNVGIATVLSATTPVMVLPILWVITRERPSKWAWVGAIFVVLGVSTIILGKA
ncbi:DMT family transporter [Amylibacter sp. SFDW26]|uniref:DMT family transporter n=1 Tax=Amylibacter sp. SFDW26 TaxID=2652722 RepID=UPI0012623127|nr:DMT family transporter [Amylibacter sp. SFDW26]KAB7610275.1 DMT family transporter [Amylibacter sp. SFDW26]